MNETGCIHDNTLNWGYSPDPLDPADWIPEMEAEFNRRTHEAYERLCAELGKDYKIEYAI